VGVIHNVKLLVLWNDLLISPHDLWLPWAPPMGPMSVVAHGGEDDLEVEGVTGQAEEVCHTHNIITLSFFHASGVLYGSALMCFSMSIRAQYNVAPWLS